MHRQAGRAASQVSAAAMSALLSASRPTAHVTNADGGPDGQTKAAAGGRFTNRARSAKRVTLDAAVQDATAPSLPPQAPTEGSGYSDLPPLLPSPYNNVYETQSADSGRGGGGGAYGRQRQGARHHHSADGTSPGSPFPTPTAVSAAVGPPTGPLLIHVSLLPPPSLVNNDTPTAGSVASYLLSLRRAYGSSLAKKSTDGAAITLMALQFTEALGRRLPRPSSSPSSSSSSSLSLSSRPAVGSVGAQPVGELEWTEALAAEVILTYATFALRLSSHCAAETAAAFLLLHQSAHGKRRDQYQSCSDHNGDGDGSGGDDDPLDCPVLTARAKLAIALHKLLKSSANQMSFAHEALTISHGHGHHHNHGQQQNAASAINASTSSTGSGGAQGDCTPAAVPTPLLLLSAWAAETPSLQRCLSQAILPSLVRGLAELCGRNCSDCGGGGVVEESQMAGQSHMPPFFTAQEREAFSTVLSALGKCLGGKLVHSHRDGGDKFVSFQDPVSHAYAQLARDHNTTTTTTTTANPYPNPNPNADNFACAPTIATAALVRGLDRFARGLACSGRGSWATAAAIMAAERGEGAEKKQSAGDRSNTGQLMPQQQQTPCGSPSHHRGGGGGNSPAPYVATVRQMNFNVDVLYPVLHFYTHGAAFNLFSRDDCVTAIRSSGNGCDDDADGVEAAAAAAAAATLSDLLFHAVHWAHLSRSYQIASAAGLYARALTWSTPSGGGGGDCGASFHHGLLARLRVMLLPLLPAAGTDPAILPQQSETVTVRAMGGGGRFSRTATTTTTATASAAAASPAHSVTVTAPAVAASFYRALSVAECFTALAVAALKYSRLFSISDLAALLPAMAKISHEEQQQHQRKHKQEQLPSGDEHTAAAADRYRLDCARMDFAQSAALSMLKLTNGCHARSRKYFARVGGARLVDRADGGIDHHHHHDAGGGSGDGHAVGHTEADDDPTVASSDTPSDDDGRRTVVNFVGPSFLLKELGVSSSDRAVTPAEMIQMCSALEQISGTGGGGALPAEAAAAVGLFMGFELVPSFLSAGELAVLRGFLLHSMPVCVGRLSGLLVAPAAPPREDQGTNRGTSEPQPPTQQQQRMAVGDVAPITYAVAFVVQAALCPPFFARLTADEVAGYTASLLYRGAAAAGSCGDGTADAPSSSSNSGIMTPTPSGEAAAAVAVAGAEALLQIYPSRPIKPGVHGAGPPSGADVAALLCDALVRLPPEEADHAVFPLTRALLAAVRVALTDPLVAAFIKRPSQLHQENANGNNGDDRDGVDAVHGSTDAAALEVVEGTLLPLAAATQVVVRLSASAAAAAAALGRPGPSAQRALCESHLAAVAAALCGRISAIVAGGGGDSDGGGGGGGATAYRRAAEERAALLPFASQRRYINTLSLLEVLMVGAANDDRSSNDGSGATAAAARVLHGHAKAVCAAMLAAAPADVAVRLLSASLPPTGAEPALSAVVVAAGSGFVCNVPVSLLEVLATGAAAADCPLRRLMHSLWLPPSSGSAAATATALPLCGWPLLPFSSAAAQRQPAPPSPSPYPSPVASMEQPLSHGFDAFTDSNIIGGGVDDNDDDSSSSSGNFCVATAALRRLLASTDAAVAATGMRPSLDTLTGIASAAALACPGVLGPMAPRGHRLGADAVYRDLQRFVIDGAVCELTRRRVVGGRSTLGRPTPTTAGLVRFIGVLLAGRAPADALQTGSYGPNDNVDNSAGGSGDAAISVFLQQLQERRSSSSLSSSSYGANRGGGSSSSSSPPQARYDEDGDAIFDPPGARLEAGDTLPLSSDDSLVSLPAFNVVLRELTAAAGRRGPLLPSQQAALVSLLTPSLMRSLERAGESVRRRPNSNAAAIAAAGFIDTVGLLAAQDPALVVAAVSAFYPPLSLGGGQHQKQQQQSSSSSSPSSHRRSKPTHGNKGVYMDATASAAKANALLQALVIVLRLMDNPYSAAAAARGSDTTTGGGAGGYDPNDPDGGIAAYDHTSFRRAISVIRWELLLELRRAPQSVLAMLSLPLLGRACESPAVLRDGHLTNTLYRAMRVIVERQLLPGSSASSSTTTTTDGGSNGHGVAHHDRHPRHGAPPLRWISFQLPPWWVQGSRRSMELRGLAGSAVDVWSAAAADTDWVISRDPSAAVRVLLPLPPPMLYDAPASQHGSRSHATGAAVEGVGGGGSAGNDKGKDVAAALLPPALRALPLESWLFLVVHGSLPRPRISATQLSSISRRRSEMNVQRRQTQRHLGARHGGRDTNGNRLTPSSNSSSTNNASDGEDIALHERLRGLVVRGHAWLWATFAGCVASAAMSPAMVADLRAALGPMDFLALTTTILTVLAERTVAADRAWIAALADAAAAAGAGTGAVTASPDRLDNGSGVSPPLEPVVAGWMLGRPPRHLLACTTGTVIRPTAEPTVQEVLALCCSLQSRDEHPTSAPVAFDTPWLQPWLSLAWSTCLDLSATNRNDNDGGATATFVSVLERQRAARREQGRLAAELQGFAVANATTTTTCSGRGAEAADTHHDNPDIDTDDDGGVQTGGPRSDAGPLVLDIAVVASFLQALERQQLPYFQQQRARHVLRYGASSSASLSLEPPLTYGPVLLGMVENIRHVWMRAARPSSSSSSSSSASPSSSSVPPASPLEVRNLSCLLSYYCAVNSSRGSDGTDGVERWGTRSTTVTSTPPPPPPPAHRSRAGGGVDAIGGSGRLSFTSSLASAFRAFEAPALWLAAADAAFCDAEQRRLTTCVQSLLFISPPSPSSSSPEQQQPASSSPSSASSSGATVAAAAAAVSHTRRRLLNLRPRDLAALLQSLMLTTTTAAAAAAGDEANGQQQQQQQRVALLLEVVATVLEIARGADVLEVVRALTPTLGRLEDDETIHSHNQSNGGDVPPAIVFARQLRRVLAGIPAIAAHDVDRFTRAELLEVLATLHGRGLVSSAAAKSVRLAVTPEQWLTDQSTFHDRVVSAAAAECEANGGGGGSVQLLWANITAGCLDGAAVSEVHAWRMLVYVSTFIETTGL